LRDKISVNKYIRYVFIDTDYLVIGSGLAGQRAALILAEYGRVIMVTKRRQGDNATSWAQGGIASVTDATDSFAKHIDDTLKAGAGLCNEKAVESIIEAGPDAIKELSELGVVFDRHDKKFDLNREGGHSARRILHVKDATGQELDRALKQRVAANTNIQVWQHHIAIDLITLHKLGHVGDNRCVGAYILRPETGEVITLRSKATLIATGGAGKVYLYTSNPDVATGDGIAMGFRAGAKISNMEFFQFHPTCLFHPHAKSFLISEALRGEGGILKTRGRRSLMQGVHPMSDLAPRDIVARAIDREMKKSGEDHVLLDITHRDSDFIIAHFPNIHRACLGLGIDMTKQPIPVVPAAHYVCGGLDSDLEGQTSLPGLWVAGEAACTGLHGANRLASNSLLEAAVLSKRAADSMMSYARRPWPPTPVPIWDAGEAEDPDEAVVVSHNWDELRRTMWNYVGIVRSDKRLQRALNRVKLLQEEIHEYYWNFRLTHDLLELRNVATLGHLIVASALERRESRGLHYTIDCPNTLDEPPTPRHLSQGPAHTLLWSE
jgi:L-aspartate oxidase